MPIDQAELDAPDSRHGLEVPAVPSDERYPLDARRRGDENVTNEAPAAPPEMRPDRRRLIRHSCVDREHDAGSGKELELTQVLVQGLAEAERRPVAAQPLEDADGADGEAAVALAIRRYPQLNGIVARGRIMLRETVDIFIQVAVEGGSDLSGVKIARADEKSVLEIARETEERVERLRQRRDRQVERTKSLLDRVPVRLLGPAVRTLSYLTYDLDLDLTRFDVVKDGFGSAMVTNVGTFGLAQAYAPLVPFSRVPLVVLVGEVQDKAVVEAGRVVVRPMMTLGAGAISTSSP